MTGAFQRLQESLNEAKIAATHRVNEIATMNEKIVEMWPNKDSVEKSGNRLTTDSGTKVYDADHWLKVVDPSTGHNGPSLLEDQIAREKIHRCMHIPSSSPLSPPSDDGNLAAVTAIIETNKCCEQPSRS